MRVKTNTQYVVLLIVLISILSSFSTKPSTSVSSLSGTNPGSDLEMPNVITPNNDGKNDVFSPINLSGVKSATLVIYSQWGFKIFETNNIRKGWDGHFNGRIASEGTYYWMIKYKTYNNPEAFQFKNGSLSLIKK